MKFQAAILAKSQQDLVVDEIELASPLQAGQVLVQVRKSGICGAQINEIDAVKGHDRYLPHLLGHEGVGEVVEVGPATRTVRPGDTVVMHWMIGSGIQADPASYVWRDSELNAGWVTTLSQFTVVSENRVTRLDFDLDDRFAPLLGCAATTAWGCLVNDARLRVGESVVVLGTGGVGLLTVDAARAGGAFPIIAVDRYPAKAAYAREMGATSVFDSSNQALESEIRRALAPAVPEVVIETTGAKSMIELAYRLASSGGRAVLVGVPHHLEPVVLDTLSLHFGMVFTGSKGGSVVPDTDIPRLARLAQRGVYRIEKLPIEEFLLEDVNIGIRALREGAAGRVMISMESG